MTSWRILKDPTDKDRRNTLELLVFVSVCSKKCIHFKYRYNIYTYLYIYIVNTISFN